jgi:hypothetical protein
MSLSTLKSAIVLAQLGCLPLGGSLAFAGDPANEPRHEYVAVRTLLASPGQYEAKRVVIRGAVVEAIPAVFPNGRRYYALLLREGDTAITVFSWQRPPASRGDDVEVRGVFHTWRFNLHNVIESDRITRTAPRGTS